MAELTIELYKQLRASEQQLRLLLRGHGYHMFKISWDGLMSVAESDVPCLHHSVLCLLKRVDFSSLSP